MTDGAAPQWVRGTASRQAHADLPPGTVEEEHGREGFTGRASHLYRLHAPTGWRSIAGPLRPHALDTGNVAADADDLAVTMLDNADVRIATWQLPENGPSWFLREADGDTCYFVHHGTGSLGTEYGPLAYRPGDFLVVPRGTTHRFEPSAPTAPAVRHRARRRYRPPRPWSPRPPRAVRSRGAHGTGTRAARRIG